MSTYYTILTNVGLAKLINAQALGTVVQWSAMAVGDGNGNPTTPTQSQTSLLREKYRAPLNQLTIDATNPNYLIAEMIIPANQGGWTIHEVGVFDDAGDMVAVANFPMTYKPVLADGSTRDLVIRIIVEVSNAATVQLKIDPAVVLASRQWVTANFVEKPKMAGGTTNQVLCKKSNSDLDMEWRDPLAAVQVVVSSREESQTLAAGQVIVDLASITTNGCAVYIEGIRLLKTQFAVNTSTRLTLASSYPAGTRVTIVQNEETGASSSLQKLQNLSDLSNVSAARTNLDVYSKSETLALGPPVGSLIPMATPIAPSGTLKANGAAVSRTTYAALFAALVTASGFTSKTFTVNIASPAVFSRSAHGYVGGERLRLSTTGALPTGINTTTDYFVEVIDANTYYLSTSVFGPRVATSGAQSGVHSSLQSWFGLGDGSTTFNVPDTRGEFLRGWADDKAVDTGRVFGSAQAASIVSLGDAALTGASVVSFYNNLNDDANAYRARLNSDGAPSTIANVQYVGVGANISGAATDAAMYVRPRNLAVMYCIKY